MAQKIVENALQIVNTIGTDGYVRLVGSDGVSYRMTVQALLDIVNANIDIDIDDTLTVSGAAADAKTVGDALESTNANVTTNTNEISDLKEDLCDLPYAVYYAERVTDGLYLNSSGATAAQSGWSVTPYLRIGSSATYYIKTAITSDNVKSCYYTKDKTFISAFKTGTAGTAVITAPANAYYIRFSIQTADTADFTYTSALAIEGGDSVILPNNIKGYNLSSSVKDKLIEGEYYNPSGGITSSSSWARSALYAVNEGDEIVIEQAAYQCATYFDSGGTFVSSVSVSGTGASTAFTVPSGVAYMGLNVLLSTLSGYSCKVNGVMLGGKYSIDWLETNKSIWSLKTYISHGDSITWQDGKTWSSGDDVGETARGYQTIFSESVGLKSYNNQGKNGWSMAVVNGNGVVNTVTSIADYTDYDLCTIACGTNDFKLNVPLGTLGAIGDTSFDTSTFYGAYRTAIEYILTSSPTIRLVLMTPLQRNNSGYDVNYTNSAGHKLIDYVNAVKALGEMYGLPVCDMYSNSGFTSLTLSTYTLDGLHPNTAGYIRMGGYLTGFLNAVGN